MQREAGTGGRGGEGRRGSMGPKRERPRGPTRPLQPERWRGARGSTSGPPGWTGTGWSSPWRWWAGRRSAGRWARRARRGGSGARRGAGTGRCSRSPESWRSRRSLGVRGTWLWPSPRRPGPLGSCPGCLGCRSTVGRVKGMCGVEAPVSRGLVWSKWKHQLWIWAPEWAQDCPKLGRLHAAWLKGVPTQCWLGGRRPWSRPGRTLRLGGGDPSWSPGSAPNTCSARSLSHVQLCVTAWTAALQAPLSMGFSAQEYCSGLPFAPTGALPTPGIEPVSLALQEDSLQLSHWGTLG